MIDRKKQIEEMALDICISRHACNADTCRKCNQHERCLYQDIAYALYNKGYRKQSEGKWIKHTDEYDCEYFECSNCHEESYPPDNEFAFDIIPKYCQECGAKMKGGK